MDQGQVQGLQDDVQEAGPVLHQPGDNVAGVGQVPGLQLEVGGDLGQDLVRPLALKDVALLVFQVAELVIDGEVQLLPLAGADLEHIALEKGLSVPPGRHHAAAGPRRLAAQHRQLQGGGGTRALGGPGTGRDQGRHVPGLLLPRRPVKH